MSAHPALSLWVMRFNQKDQRITHIFSWDMFPVNTMVYDRLLDKS